MKSEIKLISIVTVVYNDILNISKTIESVIKYRTPEIEYIIIDGRSSDGTLEMINKYKENIDVVVSEPDKGIYDAMNKALLIANGNYIININCGDILLSNPLDLSVREAIINNNYDLILFNVLQSNGIKFNNKISKSIKFHNTIHHQGVLYKVDKKELYDLKYKVFSDFDYNQRIYKRKPKIFKSNSIIVNHDIHGISHNRKYFNENYLIIKKNFGIIYIIISYLYFKKQGLISRFK